jgi:hypothetical protein
VWISSVGLWYSVVGKEGLNIDTYISVYRGSCDGVLQCIGGMDRSCDGTSVQWKTENDLVYYIKIYADVDALGEFGMTLTSFALPKNNACLGSIVLSPSDDETIVVIPAGLPPDVVPVCFYTYPDEATGIWYQMEGKGKAISISSCSSFTNIDTAISVYKGSCEDLSCVSDGISDYTCQGRVAHRAIFLAEEGTVYFIFLQSPYGYGGDVGLKITEFESAENYACLGSIVFPRNNETIDVFTVESTPDVIPICSNAFLNVPGVWYQMKGEDKAISISSCSSPTNIEVSISVYSGSCDNLSCVSEGMPD